jgi:hypothetical protein
MPNEAQAIPSGRQARGRVRVPSSKSLTHRYLNLALLAGRPLIVERPLLADDTRLFLAALARCGWTVEEGPEEIGLAPAGGDQRTGASPGGGNPSGASPGGGGQAALCRSRSSAATPGPCCAS